MFILQIVFKIYSKTTGPWNTSHSDLNLFEIKYWVISTHNPKVWFPYIKQSSRYKAKSMKYRSQWPSFILRWNNRLYWLIIPKYDVHLSDCLQDIRQNHWTMKYRSRWPKFILRSNIQSYWLVIPKYDVHMSNSLQDIRQNHWTMKYRSQWPTLIFRSNIMSYWLIFQKFDVHPLNSLQDIRQNHWLWNVGHGDHHLMTSKSMS